MPTYESTQIRVKPFVVGAPRDGYVVLRTVDGPHYISLTANEYRVLQRLADLELTLDAYVKWHLPGREGLSFHQALQLLLRLQKALFFEEVFSEGVLQRLDEIESLGRRPLFLAVERALAAGGRFLSYPLRLFRDFQVPEVVSAVCRLFLSLEGVAVLSAILLVLGLRSHFGWSQVLTMLNSTNTGPTALVAQLSLWFTICGLTLGTLEAMLLKADPRALVPWSLRVCCLFFVRIDVCVDHALLLARDVAARFFLVCLALPWFGVFALWWLASVTGVSTLYLGSFSFLCFGVAKACPLYRGILIRALESWTGSQELLLAAKEYLRRKVFIGLLNRKAPRPLEGRVASGVPLGVEQATHLIAAGAIGWLYLTGLAFMDVFRHSHQWFLGYLLEGPGHADFWSSALLISVALSVVGILAGAFLWILVGNVVAVAHVPLRRARRGLSEFRRSPVSSSNALMHFLRDNPVFADLPQNILNDLRENFHVRSYRRGQAIVTQGEQAEEFFVLADGGAQVVKEKPDGTQEVLALLYPGDSFGEVAFVEETVRTATVRATPKAVVLALSRKNFDSLFPVGSALRKNLTQVLRSVKLIQESQALSHLSPRQIREFLAIARPTVFASGQNIVTEGENAQSAFILTTGTAKVCTQFGSRVLARLGPGDLVGMTGILKSTKRNADVIAETEVTALRVDRDDFLRLCMTNIFVAILIANLSENQSSQNSQKRLAAG